MSAISRGTKGLPQEAEKDLDAGMQAAALYEMLSSGYYKTEQGKRKRISGDLSKLRFAEGITSVQRKQLADFSFRTKKIPGTQEIRTKIGHVCFWGSVVYGNGIFMTISPGERHNYLAIRLSRYRARDPYIVHSHDKDMEVPWIGAHRPSLEANAEDEFEAQVLGYDARKLLLARDPLAAVLAFGVQVRVQLATLFGIRMCPDCPHCEETDLPCQDAFGSSAEAMGGLAGRSDGMVGAVECQKSSGSLHLHFWNFIQRAHQYHTLQEIGRMLADGLLHAADLKNFCAELCAATYNDEQDLDKNIKQLEAAWPRFHEKEGQEAASSVRWGNTDQGA
jgi:hypothetical protein